MVLDLDDDGDAGVLVLFGLVGDALVGDGAPPPDSCLDGEDELLPDLWILLLLSFTLRNMGPSLLIESPGCSFSSFAEKLGKRESFLSYNPSIFLPRYTISSPSPTGGDCIESKRSLTIEGESWSSSSDISWLFSIRERRRAISRYFRHSSFVAVITRSLSSGNAKNAALRSSRVKT